tara:strand:+ start:140 stop:898 length:759 start_codon:yes stop_codon:yes gene_type:complete
MLRPATFGVALCAIAMSTGAQADDSWRFQLTPYLWAAGSATEVQPRAGGPTLRSDMKFGEVLDNLDGALFLTATARYKRFVLLGDLTWVSLSNEGSITSKLAVPVAIKGDVTQTSETLAAGYSVVSQPGVTLDLVGGLRAWQIDTSVSAEARIAPYYTLGASTSRNLSWVDPIVGMRLNAALSPKWSLTGYGDAGGYDGRSTWQLLGTLNYRFSDRFSVSAGYRHMSIEYEDAKTRLDIDMSGPLIGASLRF